MVTQAPTIFVQIASYRDPECQWTVKDLFEKAERPGQVTVGICWQCDAERDKDCFTVPSPRPAQTKSLFFPAQESGGVCWARAHTQTLFGDQDYVLMIDSHMRFIQGWDTALIAELARCGSPKSFLSTYPPGYKPPHNLEPNPMPIVMRAKSFDASGDIRFDGEVLARTPEKPLRGAFLAAGLLFAPGKFVRDVPYDPFIYFNQEEITLAARAFTHGWDVYAPTKAFIYHYYNEPQKGDVRAVHWQDRADWLQFQVLSHERFEFLLAGKEPANPAAARDMSRYGLGRERSLEEFEAFCGIDFRNKISSERARKAQFIEGIERYRVPPVSPPALRKGDILPPVALKDMRGNPRSTAEFAGQPCLLCVLPAGFDAYVGDFMIQFRALAQKISTRVVLIAPVAAEDAAGYAARNGISGEMLIDSDRLAGGLLGYASRLHDTPVSIALDGTQVIRGVYDNRNAGNHIADLERAAALITAL